MSDINAHLFDFGLPENDAIAEELRVTSVKNPKFAFNVSAPFLINGTWKWLTWTDQSCGGNSHAAINAKGAEVGATAWAFNQGSFELVRVAP